jgi:hypothetical protein
MFLLLNDGLFGPSLGKVFDTDRTGSAVPNGLPVEAQPVRRGQIFALYLVALSSGAFHRTRHLRCGIEKSSNIIEKTGD